MVALNSALFCDGLFVHVGPRVRAELPLHTIHVSSGHEGGGSFARNLLVVEPEDSSDLSSLMGAAAYREHVDGRDH